VPPPTAVSEMLVVVQVKIVVVGGVMAATGGLLSRVITMKSVSVQPLAAVTVTV